MARREAGELTLHPPPWPPRTGTSKGYPVFSRQKSVRKKLASVQSVLGGQSVLVLGSAPHPQIPPRDEFTRVVCVNGSPFVAHQNGLVPDVTVFGGYNIRNRANPQALAPHKLRNLTGLSTGALVYFDVGSGSREAKREFAKRNVSYTEFVSISGRSRADMVNEVFRSKLTDEDGEGKISNGGFAIALVLWAGASSLILSGFSLQDGHSSLPGESHHKDDPLPQATRRHLDADRLLFTTLAQKFPRASTTSKRLSTQTGIPVFG